MGAVLTLAALALTACGSGPSGQGGPGDAPATPDAAAVNDAAPEPAPTESADPSLDNASVDLGDEDAETGVDSDDLEAADVVGVARVHWEPTPTSVRLFSYDLTECTLDGTTIAVQGIGVEDDTGAPSTLTMDMAAAELLHEGTGTYHASGHATFTADDSEIVSDGRVYTSSEGYTGPSMFDYRVTDTTVVLKVSLWIGAADAGAGAVDVTCHA